MFFLFYILWGFNYLAPTITTSFHLSNPSMDEKKLFKRLDAATESLNESAHTFHSIKDHLSFKAIEQSVREELNKFMASVNLDQYPSVRVRNIFNGSLLHLETSGIYLPFVFEGHVDNGLYFIQHPFTACHEMAHGYGFTEEADCNFLAYVACVDSEKIELKYSAEIAYWRYLARNARQVNKQRYTEEIRSCLSELVVDDLNQIYKNIESYPPFLGKYRDKMYDLYLKSNGVKDGIMNYSQFILMVEAWNERQLQ